MIARAASLVGNRGFAASVARMPDGEGILPGGIVHPDVQSAIEAASGGGRRLGITAPRLSDLFGDTLADVRVHTDARAEALARSVSARAFTVGNEIFFGAGEYRPATASGDALIAHEVAHVVQQRGARQTGPLTVSQPGDPLEREAEDVARGM